MDKRIKYSFEEKLWAVRSIAEGQESCLSAARKLGLKIYQAQGASGLLKETRGRKKPGMAKKTPKKISKNTDPAADKLEALQ